MTVSRLDDRVDLWLDGTALGVLAPGCVELDRRVVGAVEPGSGTDVTPSGGAAVDVRLAAGVGGRWTATPVGRPDVLEVGLVVRNDGEVPVRLTRLDPLDLRLDAGLGHWRTHWYRAAWGDEFRPRQGTTRHDVLLDVRSGRSSHGTVPWLGLEHEDRPLALVVAPAWSGNWHIDALAGGTVRAGISPWQLTVELAPGEELRAPSVVVALGESLDEAAVALQHAVRDHWLPRTPASDALPVEWNHWWPFEDVDVNQEVIWREGRRAGEVGIDVVTLDAGWFGAADAASDWQEQRGDWSSVNAERFPDGLGALGTGLRAAGVAPGIWIEAEAVGRSARLRADRPDVLALATDGRRHDPSYRMMTVSLDPEDPTFLGYVCLGSPGGREHVLESMTRAVEAIGGQWLKLDFNIDPDAGCTRTDHGHGAGDGLLRHYLGLYQVLDTFRERHPHVLLEACSSGGLRIDLGLARHVHGFFLSDPDWTEHHLEVLMGAARLLPPLGILHWSHSWWRGDHPDQQVDWAGLPVEAFDTMVRAAMVHRLGFSLRLDDLRPDLRDRLRVHLDTFRRELAPLVREGVLRPLTDPPERGGLGERVPALQLTDAAGDRHAVLLVALDGVPVRPPTVRLRALDPDRSYVVRDLASGEQRELPGRLLLEGWAPHAGDATSWLLRVDPVR